MMNNKWRGIRKGWKVKIKLSICEDNITVNLGNTRELKDKLTIATETTKYIGSDLTGNARYLWKKILNLYWKIEEFARWKYNIFLGRKVAYWKDIKLPGLAY